MGNENLFIRFVIDKNFLKKIIYSEGYGLFFLFWEYLQDFYHIFPNGDVMFNYKNPYWGLNGESMFQHRKKSKLFLPVRI